MRATLEETASWIGKGVISIVAIMITTSVIDKGTEAARKAVEYYKVNKEKKELEQELKDKEV